MATKYFMNGGVNNNWSADTNWSTTSSAGPNNTTHAISGDAAILDSGSPNCTIDTSCACDSINCTGYTATLAVGTQTLSVGGNVTLGSGMTITGTTGYLTLTASGTLTANGKTWPARIELAGTAQTYTLADAWSVTGQFKTSGSTSVTINSSTLTVAGGTQLNNSITMGTTDLTLTGGTWATQGWLELDTTLQGDITLGTGVNEPNFRAATLTYSSGTITMGTADLNVQGGSVGTPTVLNTSGVTWYRVVLSGGGDSIKYFSLSSTLNATTLAVMGGAGPVFVGAAGFNVGTLTNSTALDSNRSITLLQGNTYTVTTAITLAGTGANHWTLTSSNSTDVTFTFSGGSSPVLTLVKATHLDSSGGTAIYTDDTITSCLNWFNGSPSTGLMWL